MKMISQKKGQQEIVGFVLIVVLVVVGLMVYLGISLRSGIENVDSVEVENMLDAMMKQTTECAIVYEPDYDDFEDLFKSAYKGSKCSNLGESAKEYLNSSIREVLGDMVRSDATIKAYELQFYEKDSQDYELIFFEGSCSGTINSAQRIITTGSDRLVVVLKICR